MRALIDSDILLDVLAEREQFLTNSGAVWELVETGVVEGVVSALSCSNIYYIARKQFGHDRALQAVRKVSEVFQIAAVDARIVMEAIESGLPDFEDAIQVFAGRDAGATVVVTRDVDGFSGGPLKVLRPAELVSALAQPE